MLKFLRKHNRWIMIGFSVFLLAAFTAPQTIQQMGGGASSVKVASIDGRTINLVEYQQASREVQGLTAAVPGLMSRAGVTDSDPHHWLLLVHEAERAGLVGGRGDGADFIREVAEASLGAQLDRARMFAQFRPESVAEMPEGLRKIIQATDVAQQGKLIDEETARLGNQLKNVMATKDIRMEADIEMAFARAQGVRRLLELHGGAARFSDLRAQGATKSDRDAAAIDVVVIPAERLAGQSPEPTEAELLAHFERFKGTRPGEGEFGIGYLLPARLKLETITVDRAAISTALQIDPVEANKRYRGDRTRYPGEFAAERARVEDDMRRELTDRIMQDAQLAIQAEVLKVTRKLDLDGRFKKLPLDWDSIRPRWEKVAPVVVETVQKNHGVTVPLPTVTARTDKWYTAEDLRGAPDLAGAEARQGALTRTLPDALFAVRELGGDGGLIAAQVGLPMADNTSAFVDRVGNRHYVTIIAARGESPPDSMAEIRERVVKDRRELVAYEALAARAPELERAAVSGGLEAARDLLKIPGDPVAVTRGLQVTRGQTFEASPGLLASANASIVERASGFDPLAPRDSIAADRATMVVANPGKRTVAVVRITEFKPLTREGYRAVENQGLDAVRRKEPLDASMNPFSLGALLKRHNYKTAEDLRIETPDQFKAKEGSGRG